MIFLRKVLEKVKLSKFKILLVFQKIRVTANDLYKLLTNMIIKKAKFNAS